MTKGAGKPSVELGDVLDDLRVRAEATNNPVLFAEIQISRQYSAHILSLPGQTRPGWYRTLWQAFDAAELAGYKQLELVLDSTLHILCHNQGET